MNQSIKNFNRCKCLAKRVFGLRTKATIEAMALALYRTAYFGDWTKSKKG